MKFYNTPNIIPAGTVMNTTLHSESMPLQTMYCYSIQVFFTGTPTGTFKLQASDDVYPSVNQTNLANLNWSDIANSSFTVAAAGNVMWNYSLLAGYNWVRVVYTDGSSGESTATITSATLNGKG
jgi:hypothetical protein